MAGCSAHASTQATIVVGGADVTCDDSVVAQDAYESALNRARCEHPDMLVHPRAWTLRRTSSPPNVSRFVLDHDGAMECSYDVAHDGKTRRN